MSKNEWQDRFGSEWPYIVRLGGAISDPEEKRAFWEAIKRKKKENEKYSIFWDFPQKDSVNKKAMRECCDFVRSLRRPVTEPEKDKTGEGE